MFEWFTFAQLAVAVCAGVLCLILGSAGKIPSDVSNGAVALVGLLLLIQLVVAIVSPFVGNQPQGDLLEYYLYLVSALILPPVAIGWGLIDRTRWSTIILGVVALAVGIMVYRMNVIWFAL